MTGGQKAVSGLLGENRTVRPVMSLIFALLALGGSIWLFLSTASHVPGPEGLLFWIWHGSW